MTSHNQIDVLGLGSVTLDFVGTVDTWPDKGVKKLLQEFSIHDGGLVGTALAAAARLGGKVAYVGKLGYSEAAERAVKGLEKENIDTSLVIRTANADPIVAFVFTNTLDGQRNIFWTRQNVQYPMPGEIPDKKWFARTSVVLVDYESGSAGIETAKIAADHNIPVVVDVEKDEPHVPELFGVSSHIVISEEFAVGFTGKSDPEKIIESLKTSPKQTVILTRGDKGCIGLTAEGLFKLPAFKVDVVDTTGCGDVFHGAYALAIARGQTVIDAARFASGAAALCATKIGGRDGIPSAKLLNSFILNQ